MFVGWLPGASKSISVLCCGAASGGCEYCADATIDGGGGNGIAGIVNSMGAFGLAMKDGWSLSEKLWWCPWLWLWLWPPGWWWWCGNDFGRIFCLLESVVRDNRSLKALRAICLLRSMSCISTLCTDTTEVNECAELLIDEWALTKPMRRKILCSGVTRAFIAGCKIVGKKLKLNENKTKLTKNSTQTEANTYQYWFWYCIVLLLIVNQSVY